MLPAPASCLDLAEEVGGALSDVSRGVGMVVGVEFVVVGEGLVGSGDLVEGEAGEYHPLGGGSY